jgi:hypothetical protein
MDGAIRLFHPGLDLDITGERTPLRKSSTSFGIPAGCLALLFLPQAHHFISFMDRAHAEMKDLGSARSAISVPSRGKRDNGPE